MNIFLYIIIAVISYLIGSIPFSYLIPKWFGKIDIRQHGSGNTGTTNVARTLGLKIGIIAFVGDFLKGVLPVFIVTFYLSRDVAALAAAASVLGHCYPVWLGFKGGKGIATSAGALLFLMPDVFIILGIYQFVVIIASKYMSLASITSALLLPILAFSLDKSSTLQVFSLLLGLFVVYKHKDNVKRLLNGSENKLGKKK